MAPVVEVMLQRRPWPSAQARAAAAAAVMSADAPAISQLHASGAAVEGEMAAACDHPGDSTRGLSQGC